MVAPFPPLTDTPFGPPPAGITLGPAGPLPMAAEAALLPALLPPPPPPLDMAAVMEHFLGQTRGPLGPQHVPKWYRPPPRPNVEWVIAQAREDHANARPWIQVVHQLFRRLYDDYHGVFGKDANAIRTLDVEPYYSTMIKDEHRMAVSVLAAKDMRIRALYRDPMERDDARKKEDLCSFARKCFILQHAEAGNADLRWDEASMLASHGMLVAYIAIDPEDPLCGFTYQLLDPTTVYPHYEGKRGLRCVTRLYQERLANVVGYWDDDGSLAASMYTPQKLASGSLKKRRPNDWVEVIEYYDREWRMLVVDGEHARTWRHRYGKVPIVIQAGTEGEPMWATSQDAIPVSMYDEGGVLRTYSAVQRGGSAGRGRKTLPYTFRLWRQNDQLEAMMGRMLTEFRKGGNPPLVVKRSLASHNKPRPAIDVRDGARSYLFSDESVDRIPTDPPPHIANALQAVLQQDALTGRAPLAAYGQNPSANTSGTALQALDRAGAHHWVGMFRTQELFHQRCLSWVLEAYRDWGDILGESGYRGTLIIPYRKPGPGQPGAFEITPDVVRRSGVLIEVKLTRLPLDALPGLLAAAIQGLNAGIWGPEFVAHLMDFDDPDAVEEDAKDYALMQSPEMVHAERMQRIAEKFGRALQTGNMQQAQEQLWIGEYVASELDRSRSERRAGAEGGGAPPGGLAPSPAGPPGGPPPIPQNQPGLPGTSLPQLGIQPGTQGGAPRRVDLNAVPLV